MNVKKKIQGFFSLTRRANAGFTLVELIVVIAILAILAGVAIPVYSGYIKKAELAADQAMLDELNTAFAAACAMNGVNPTQIDATATISSGVADVATGNSEVNADFDELYTPTGVFKSVTALSYNKTVGMFEIADATGGVYASLLDTIKTQYPDLLVALKDSTFGSTMGMEALMDQLDKVTVIAAGMTEDEAMQAIFNSTAFQASAMQALGIDGDPSQLLDKLDELTDDMAENQGMTKEEAEDRVYANAAVLYTAQKTAGMSTEEAKQMFEDATRDGILAKMQSGDGEGLAQAALVCGMYTAYSKQPNTTVDSKVNVQNVLNALENDADFNNYLNSEQGQKDLEGYLASLEILNSATQGNNSDEVENLMKNGFADSDLVAGLSGLIGN